MKRKLAVILTIFMLVSVLAPMNSFAAANDKGLEKAIKTAKSYFDVPEDYKLVSSYGSYGDKTVWNLSWYSEKDLGGGIDASIDENGTLIRYNRYKPEFYQDTQRKFPSISKEEARKKAESFIKKVNPSAFSSVRYEEDNYNNLIDYAYYFNYTRVVNNVPYYSNNISISIHRDTGEIIDYYCNWTDGLEFPDASKVISIEKAQEAYGKEIGLKLMYQSAKVKDEIKVFPVYVPKYDNYSYAVDAVTGEKINISPIYEVYYGTSSYNMAMKEAAMMDAGSGGEIVLSPEEEKELNEISGLISLEKAEKIARDSKAIGIDKELKLEHYSLSRDWYDRNKILWTLNFVSNAPEKGEYRYANVTIDARTGEIVRFYVSAPYNAEEKPKDDEAAAKAAVEKFLKEFKPDKFEQVELDENYNDNIIIMEGDEKPRYYWFHFSRQVDGIPFQNNGFSVNYDAVYQKVTEFSMDWYDVEFPSIENVVPVDKVYEVLFDQVGLELQYKDVYNKVKGEEYVRVSGKEKPEIKLVYMLKSNKPHIFDAYTGNIVSYDGTPYKENKPVEYTDIGGHFAEKQIKTLAEYGVYLEGKEFKPGEQIKQKEFFTLLTRTMPYYYGPILYADSSQEEIDNMYSYLIREKIITADEKNPEAAVSREDAVKYIIRSLKYNEVAEIKGIYNCPFDDEAEINPDLVGYVTIAYGLKIVNGSGGKFMPKKTLTRAEAAIMIYNYLQK
ncbi:MAG TPA: peptidase M4 [Clostridiaceae bacterium]|nr:peptidase M4 [Clostridiaceae bacterium]